MWIIESFSLPSFLPICFFLTLPLFLYIFFFSLSFVGVWCGGGGGVSSFVCVVSCRALDLGIWVGPGLCVSMAVRERKKKRGLERESKTQGKKSNREDEPCSYR